VNLYVGTTINVGHNFYIHIFSIKAKPNKIPFFNLTPQAHSTVLNTWKAKWSSHTSSAKWYKSIVSEILRTPWFCNSNLSRFYIISFVGHNRLPAHDFYLDLNSVPFFTPSVNDVHHNITEICNFSHLLFHCPNLSSSKLSLLQFLSKKI